MEFPANIPLEDIEEKFPGFTDPSVDWKYDGAANGEPAKRECRKLIEALPCPRCNRAGHTVIEIWQYWRGGILSFDCRPVAAESNQ